LPLASVYLADELALSRTGLSYPLAAMVPTIFGDADD
jgi:hypothetical protein